MDSLVALGAMVGSVHTVAAAATTVLPAVQVTGELPTEVDQDVPGNLATIRPRILARRRPVPQLSPVARPTRPSAARTLTLPTTPLADTGPASSAARPAVPPRPPVGMMRTPTQMAGPAVQMGAQVPLTTAAHRTLLMARLYGQFAAMSDAQVLHATPVITHLLHLMRTYPHN